MDCIFCKIIKKEIPSKTIYEDDRVIMFEDINPQAPFHALVVPKVHVPTVLELKAENSDYLFKVFEVISKVMTEKGYSTDGFRTVLNTNQAAGQTVFHIHFHVLAGRLLMWPPG
ncbi:MAG TPA: histidine triad nucleotide-binding protein [Candidatus Wallbacteria bacterium]|nr:histidine triad nucleotide-binding protein [Candidatus Wallbacteria bacterium]